MYIKKAKIATMFRLLFHVFIYIDTYAHTCLDTKTR